jgi:hypothetical protein
MPNVTVIRNDNHIEEFEIMTDPSINWGDHQDNDWGTAVQIAPNQIHCLLAVGGFNNPFDFDLDISQDGAIEVHNDNPEIIVGVTVNNQNVQIDINYNN